MANKAEIQLGVVDTTGPAFTRVQTSMRRLAGEASSFAARFGGMGPALALAATGAAAATATLVKHAINAADAASKQAQAAGLAVEQYTALAYAAKLSGVEAAALGTSLNLLNKSIAEGSNAFAALGINTRDASGALKNSDQVLAEMADRFAAMPDGARKSQLALKLLGDSGAKLLPLLNQGSAGLATLKEEARRFGVVISGETARAAEELNDNLTRTKAAVDGLGLELARELLPTLNELSTRALKNAKDFGVLRGSVMALYEVMLGGTEPADLLEKQSQRTRESIKGLRYEIDLLTKRGVGEKFQGGVLGQLRAELAALEKEDGGSTQRLVNSLNEAAGRTRFGRGVGFKDPRLVTAQPKGAGDAKASGSAKVSEADRYIDALLRQLDATKNLTVSEQLLLDIQRGRLGVVTEGQKRELVGLAAQIDAAGALARSTEEAARARAAAAEDAARAAAALSAEVDHLARGNEALRQEIQLIGADADARAALDRARLDSTIALREESLAMAKNAGAAAVEIQALEAQIRLLRERGGLVEQRGIAERLDEEAKQFADITKKMRENIQDSLGDSLYEAMNGNFKNIGQGFTQMVNRLVAESLAADLTKNLFGGGKGGGGAEGLFGGLLEKFTSLLGLGKSGSGGGLFSSIGNLFGGFFADGGNPPLGKVSIVGERGPELFVPRSAGTIVPIVTQAHQSAANTVNYSPTFVLQQPADRRTQQQLAAAAFDGAQRAFARNG